MVNYHNYNSLLWSMIIFFSALQRLFYWPHVKDLLTGCEENGILVRKKLYDEHIGQGTGKSHDPLNAFTYANDTFFVQISHDTMLPLLLIYKNRYWIYFLIIPGWWGIRSTSLSILHHLCRPIDIRSSSSATTITFAIY